MVAHGLGHGPIGAAVAAWPAIALVGSYELLRMVIRSSQAAFDGTSDSRTTADTLQEQAAQVFVEQLAADRRSANHPRRGGAVLMLHFMRVARESLERRRGSRHD